MARLTSQSASLWLALGTGLVINLILVCAMLIYVFGPDWFRRPVDTTIFVAVMFPIPLLWSLVAVWLPISAGGWIAARLSVGKSAAISYGYFIAGGALCGAFYLLVALPTLLPGDEPASNSWAPGAVWYGVQTGTGLGAATGLLFRLLLEWQSWRKQRVLVNAA